MRTLFDMDKGNYNVNGSVFSRPSVRGIAIRGDKVLLIYSKKYDYYKFPGGGIEAGEDHSDTLIREVAEETGYHVIPESIREYGAVIRKQRDSYNPEGIFQQDNYYYLCDVEAECGQTDLDDYEAEEGFTAVWQDPFLAFNCNRYSQARDNEKDKDVIRREERVIEMVYYMILDRIHEQKEHELIERLGNPAYFEMCGFVRKYLQCRETEDIGSKAKIAYSRYEHTKHVVAWTRRLYDMEMNSFGSDNPLKYDELMIAAIFHDVGRGSDNGLPHARASVPITREYLLNHGYSEEKTEYICMLVGSHSDKWKMQQPDIDPNLLLLMEADLLDDMGALGIVMDCMITQKRKEYATFSDCYNHINRYTNRQQQTNPMVTASGRALWDEKTRLTVEFTKALEADIAYC